MSTLYHYVKEGVPLDFHCFNEISMKEVTLKELDMAPVCIDLNSEYSKSLS
jgi:hypothetical protein